MRAAVLQAPKTLRIEERPLPSLKPEEVLIRVHTTGVCGTDAHIWEGHFLATFPLVPGHEISGVVSAVGSEVKEIREGDRISVDPNITCGLCSFCRRGKPHLCINLTAIGVNWDGGFAGYCVAPARQVYRLPPQVSTEAGAFAEPIACCLHGLDRAGFKPGQSVFILGGGPIGQIMLQLTRSGGASAVILSEPQERRRELAQESGATAVLNPTEVKDLPARVFDLTDGGADLVIECVGNPRTLEQGVRCARRGGTILVFGVAPEEAIAQVKPYEIFLRELTIVGSYINPFTHSQAITALATGRVKPEKLISHRFPVVNFEEALLTSRSSSAVKVVIQPTEEEQSA